MPTYLQKKKLEFGKVLKKLDTAMYTPIAELKVTAWRTPEPVPYSKRQSGKKLVLVPGQKWGKLFDCAWFHFTGKVPNLPQRRNVVLLLDVNGEMLVVDKEGNPLRGLTTVNSWYDFSLGKPGKRVLQFAKNTKGGEKVDVWADAGCNDLFGRLNENGEFKEAVVAVCNETLRSLYYDFEVLNELMTLLPDDRARTRSLAYALAEAAACLQDYTEEEAAKARAILAPELAKKGGDPSLVISAIGHSHIDLAWLWPIRETIRKGARTFSTVLDLMDRYPDYIFGASQPQLYQWMKDHFPALYAKIKKKIEEGRWEPQGAMWVEADANVPSGESLVRQVLYGKRFFRREFGREMKTLWLPDVFGYNGALPQILKKADVDYFMTQKISWSIFNIYPHQTFWWEGIDGSRVLSHLPPEDDYNSSAAPRGVMKSERNYFDKEVSGNCLLLFGIGDGGGGPGAEHLERLQREKNLDGLAPVVQEFSDTFFKRLSKNSDRYATWVGELYLERHQGTYTTQGRNKRYNRKMEFALRELELSSVLAGRAAGAAYPSADLDAIWKEMLLYQFHDILPGSSITRVYDESLKRYKILMDQTLDLTTKSDAAWTRKIDTSGVANPLVVMNSLSWDRQEWLEYKGKWYDVCVPSMGYAVIDASTPAPKVSKLTASANRLENEFLQVRFAKDGTIESIYDKESQREVLPEGKRANVLNVYRDDGDAWDFAGYYDEQTPEHFEPVKQTAQVKGPQAILRRTLKYGQSMMQQDIVLTAGSRRIDFVTCVDWRESERMLRVEFPVDVRSEQVTCEIQYGNLKRNTHINTSWELGKYEICAQKWIDLSQPDYGVALLNDCKYGHQVRGNVLDINLLRSPGYPDPKADRAKHEFTYSLLPHPGDYTDGEVVRRGYELNVPLRVIPTVSGKGSLPPSCSFVRVDAPNVVVEAVKKAEDDEGIIVRLYETTGARAHATLQFGEPLKSAQLVNLLEEKPKRLKATGDKVEVDFAPFEIQTIKVSFKS